MESLEKSLKAAEEGNSRLAKERKVLMEKAVRIEGERALFRRGRREEDQGEQRRRRVTRGQQRRHGRQPHDTRVSILVHGVLLRI